MDHSTPPTPPQPVEEVAKKSARRYSSLDTLRGGLLVVMALNHIPSSAIHQLTQQPLGYVTAAEGFVFLAGLVVGLVYSRRWEAKGPGPTSLLLLRRGWVIYQAHLATIAGIYLWMFFYHRWTGQLPNGTPWAWFQKPVPALAATLGLLHQPGLLDVLPTYCGLLLITPLIFWQLFKKRMWIALGVSAAVWILTNFIDPPRPTIIGVINTGAFNFGAWQFLYVIGVALGFRWAKGLLPTWRPTRPLMIAVFSLIVAFSICSHTEYTFGLTKEVWFSLTNKNNLAPLRLINVGLVIVLTWSWLSSRRKELDWEPLALLGRHSLAVFSVHCVAALMMIGLPTIFDWSFYGGYLGPVVILGLMTTTAIFCERRKTAIQQAKMVTA